MRRQAVHQLWTLKTKLELLLKFGDNVVALKMFFTHRILNFCMYVCLRFEILLMYVLWSVKCSVYLQYMEINIMDCILYAHGPYI